MSRLDQAAVQLYTDELWELRLCVAGQTSKSVPAFQNLQRLCEEYLPGKYKTEVSAAAKKCSGWRFRCAAPVGVIV